MADAASLAPAFSALKEPSAFFDSLFFLKMAWKKHRNICCTAFWRVLLFPPFLPPPPLLGPLSPPPPVLVAPLLQVQAESGRATDEQKRFLRLVPASDNFVVRSFFQRSLENTMNNFCSVFFAAKRAFFCSLCGVLVRFFLIPTNTYF